MATDPPDTSRDARRRPARFAEGWKNGPFDRAFWLGDVDARLPALFRIGLALVLFVDHVTEIPIVKDLYGVRGVWPPALSAGPLHHAPDSALLVVWGVGCLALLALAAGLFTRVAAICAYVFLVSIHLRNEAICSGGDWLAQMCVFFLIWLDCGAAWSLDAKWFPAKRAKQFVAAAPWRAMQVRLALLYALTAVFKLLGAWRSGDGVYLSLQHLGFVRPLGAWLFHYPTLCKLLTWGVVGGELTVGLLILFPFRARKARLAAAIGSTMIQLGIVTMMRVGAFTWIMLWMCVLLLPEPQPAPEPPPVPAPRSRKLLLGMCVAVLAFSGYAGLHLPMPEAVGRIRRLSGLRQDFDLFGDGIDVSRWTAQATRADGTKVDILPDGFRSEVAWRYSPFFKFEFWNSLDYAAIAGWMCREAGEPLTSITLARDTAPAVLADAPLALKPQVLYTGPCPAPE